MLNCNVEKQEDGSFNITLDDGKDFHMGSNYNLASMPDSTEEQNIKLLINFGMSAMEESLRAK